MDGGSEGQRASESPPSGSGGGGEAHAVIGAVVDGVVLPQEDVPKDPQGLSALGGQVGGPDVHAAVLVPVLVVLWRGRPASRE